MIEIIFVITLIINLATLTIVYIFRPTKNNSSTKEFETMTLIIEKNLDRVEKNIKDEMSRGRIESTEMNKQTREEVSNAFKSFGDTIDKRIFNLADNQRKNFETFEQKLSDLTERNEKRFDLIRETLEKRLESLQKDNSIKLEQMRATVDEKLTETLDKRLGEKFKLVSERLELVHRGLGEMQVLASGVGDLKKVLTNVKTRGTWGEVQLGNLLEQVLSKEQYDKNVATKKGSNDRVEFAIKLPGKNDDNEILWLPIDSKFPIEDYHRLIEAHDKVDVAGIEQYSKAIETRIKQEAKYIHDKYIDPPHTTDFGILYLPTEGLYAEITQRIGLCEQLQRDYRVSVAGPNTIMALLNSLQMGFRTLTIEKRSSEVWSLLGAIKTDFSKFGDLLEKTSKKLAEASNVIDDASSKSRVIQRRLEKIQDIPIASVSDSEKEILPEKIIAPKTESTNIFEL